jgi:hypothetical protein
MLTGLSTLRIDRSGVEGRDTSTPQLQVTVETEEKHPVSLRPFALSRARLFAIQAAPAAAATNGGKDMSNATLKNDVQRGFGRFFRVVEVSLLLAVVPAVVHGLLSLSNVGAV